MRNQNCSDDCELNHCPKCGGHTLGRLESFQQCDECQLMEEANQRAEDNRETPLGEQIDGGNDHVADEMADFHDDYHAQYDDDPNPYEGTYSEE